jgi:hypothetical protein
MRPRSVFAVATVLATMAVMSRSVVVAQTSNIVRLLRIRIVPLLRLLLAPAP